MSVMEMGTQVNMHLFNNNYCDMSYEVISVSNINHIGLLSSGAQQIHRINNCMTYELKTIFIAGQENGDHSTYLPLISHAWKVHKCTSM